MQFWGAGGAHVVSLASTDISTASEKAKYHLVFVKCFEGEMRYTIDTLSLFIMRLQ